MITGDLFHQDGIVSSGDHIVGRVYDAYSTKAREGVPTNYTKAVAEAFGYTEEQLRSIPEGSSLGLSCGNPVATASIKQGEIVVDLGSGGGVDVFLAAEKVGPTGSVIGLDMSDDMISLARKNAAKKNLKPPHVAFVKALLTETLPIESNSIDCMLSNCVVNLLPIEGKYNLLREAYRILKPGGRIVLDDIIAKQDLPDYIRDDIQSHINCVSGAIRVDKYKALLKRAGFSSVVFSDTKNDLGVYYETVGQNGSSSSSRCCAPPPEVAGSLPAKPTYNVNEWVASHQIFALKEDGPADIPSSVLCRWWDAYPLVKSAPQSLTAEEVATLVRQASKLDYAVIDVRRNDHAGGHVRGSHNWAAQTFYDDLPAFHQTFKDTSKVIFYCGSSNGRGPRCAGWYQDYLDRHGDVHKSAAYVLKGGVKNWLSTFAGQDDLMDQD